MRASHSAAALLSVLVLGVAACGSNDEQPAQPPVSAFAEGTCRAAAPEVLSIGKIGAALDDAPTVAPELKASLRESQDRLSELAAAAEPTYKPALDALVVTAGFVRIRADGNTYEPALAQQLMTDYRGVLKVCAQ